MEKYLVIFLIAIVGYVLWKCLNETNEGFGDVAQSVGGVDDQNAINTLAQVARDLQKDGLKVMGKLNIKDKHIFSSDDDGWLRLRNKDSNAYTHMAVGNMWVDGGLNILPRGVIVAWNGQANAIPGGWLLCDGQNGTPDLRNRFIVGTGGEYGLGNAGGNKEIKLNATQLPPHKHYTAVGPPDWGWGDNYLGNGNNGFSGGGGARFGTGGQAFLTGNGNDGQSGCVGNPIDIRPPFYALAWIMKA
jgi:hypothetical protein